MTKKIPDWVEAEPQPASVSASKIRISHLTGNLRFVLRGGMRILQQEWRIAGGGMEWRDVPLEGQPEKDPREIPFEELDD